MGHPPQAAPHAHITSGADPCPRVDIAEQQHRPPHLEVVPRAQGALVDGEG